MDMIGRIRRLHSRGRKSVREIARLTGLSRNTIAKWLDAPVETAPKYRRDPAASKLVPFHETLTLALKAEGRRPKHERRTARALFHEIRRSGYDGGYTRVTDFVRAWRRGVGQSVATSAFVPLKFELGEAFQFDWSEEGIVVGGIYYRAQVSHMKLCASRAFRLVAYPSQGHEMLWGALQEETHFLHLFCVALNITLPQEQRLARAMGAAMAHLQRRRLRPTWNALLPTGHPQRPPEHPLRLPLTFEMVLFGQFGPPS